jgi:hypothetical protein
MPWIFNCMAVVIGRTEKGLKLRRIDGIKREFCKDDDGNPDTTKP